jgi:hypothetical protein
MIAVAAIVTHPAFEHLLRVDEALRARLARSIRKKGFLQPVVLGRWPGLETPRSSLMVMSGGWRVVMQVLPRFPASS